MKSNKEILQKAIDTYGEEAQMDMCIEEMSELTKAILKLRRYKKAHEGNYSKELYNDVVEEIADVSIMLDQMLMIFDCHEDVHMQQHKKIKRLENRLEE